MGDSSGKKEDQPTAVGGVPVYVVRQRERPFALRLVKGPGAPKDFALELAEVVVGRGLDAHITIDSESVSRRHARLQLVDGRYAIEDLGSKNGIFINGEPTRSAGLVDGDSVQLGDALFVYQQGK